MGDSNAIVYGSSVEFLKEEPEEMSLDEYIVAAVQKRSNEILLIDAITEETLRVNEFLQKSFSLAAELQSLGCNEDTVVGIISENRLEYPIVILGTMLTGATLTCYNSDFSVHELQPIFNIAKPAVVFCSVATRDKVKEVVSKTSQIIIFDTDHLLDSSPDDLMFCRLIQSTKALSAVKNKSDRTAFILYSSGTTGLPKGVMLTHGNFVFTLKLQKQNQITKKTGSMIGIAVFMCHISGLETLLTAVIRDEIGVVIQKGDQRMLLSMIQKYKMKHALVLSGTILFLIKDPVVDEYDLSSLEFLMFGGAPIKPETERALKEKLNLRYLQQIYGMTETTLYITITKPGNQKIGTCGPPIPGTQIKVVETQTGKMLGKNEIGEMYVKGPHMMKGYFGNERATAEAIAEDGWLRSGDIAYHDDDGDFFIVDRAKELIKCGGCQVSPAELEALLLTHPSIADVGVIGVQDENAVELPRAYVVKKNGTELTADEIIQYLAKMVLAFKQLHGGVEFVSEIPRNPSGKILRRKLRELWNKHSSR